MRDGHFEKVVVYGAKVAVFELECRCGKVGVLWSGKPQLQGRQTSAPGDDDRLNQRVRPTRVPFPKCVGNI
jgi:hypothetical protein